MYYQKEEKSGAIADFAERYFIFAFGVLFYTSWVYEVVALGRESAAVIYPVKNLILMVFMLLMVFAISWRRVAFDLFSTCVVIWIALCIVLWSTHPGADHLYLRRIGQAVFTFLFVTYLRQNPNNNPLAGEVLDRWFSPRVVIVGVIAIIVLNLLGLLSEDVLRGFGNSRVNFSIWLMQLVAMVFLMQPRLNVKSEMFEAIGLLILITPVYVLQNMTGGRSGMLGTVLIAAFFHIKGLAQGFVCFLFFGCILYLWRSFSLVLLLRRKII